MRKFTDFNKLWTFSIVAKHLSFSKAAIELFISQAAVSQQIKSLEEILGYSLFVRQNKQISLTRKGGSLFQIANSSLKDVVYGIQKISESSNSGVLTIDTLPSFAMKWLIPRLEKFNKLYPDINVHISASVELVDFSKDEVDMVIRYGHIVDDATNNVKLLDEQIFLVASPNIITKQKPLNNTSDLQQHTLLYDEIDCHYLAYGVKKEITWQHVASHLDADISKNRYLTFPQAHLVLQAAIMGQGVAIARSALVEEEIASGALIKVLPHFEIKSPGYDVVYAKNTLNKEKVELFTKWLISEVNNSK
jgi:LysR family glycine cleavage system transcriptional activator